MKVLIYDELIDTEMVTRVVKREKDFEIFFVGGESTSVRAYIGLMPETYKETHPMKDSESGAHYYNRLRAIIQEKLYQDFLEVWEPNKTKFKSLTA